MVLARAAALNPVTLRRMHQHVNPPTPECLQENVTLSRHLLVRATIPYPTATRPFLIYLHGRVLFACVHSVTQVSMRHLSVLI